MILCHEKALLFTCVGQVILLKFIATILTLPDGDWDALGRLVRLRFQMLPVTIVKAVADLNVIKLWICTFTLNLALIAALSATWSCLTLYKAMVSFFKAINEFSRATIVVLLFLRNLGRHNRIHLRLPVLRNFALWQTRLWLPVSVADGDFVSE